MLIFFDSCGYHYRRFTRKHRVYVGNLDEGRRGGEGGWTCTAARATVDRERSVGARSAEGCTSSSLFYSLGDAREIHVVASKVRVHGVVDVGDVVFDVNLLVDGLLARLGEVRRARERVAAVVRHRVQVFRLDDGLEMNGGRVE